jgi:hypothetical protein
MSKCEDCKKEMLDGVGCDWHYLVMGDGEVLRRQKHNEFGEEESMPCHDCNCPEGKTHHFGCDWERCPKCGGQLILCDCDFVAVSKKSKI